LNSVSDFFVVVTTPEPHAITDAYALIKLMAEEHDRHECGLIVNQVINFEEGNRIASRLAEVAKIYCGANVLHAGSVSTDPSLIRNILARKVGSAGALSSLCGQGWGQSWCNILEMLNNSGKIGPSASLDALWGAMSQPNTVRQKFGT
jgi:flagellar biosynthesis protein FlhG